MARGDFAGATRVGRRDRECKEGLSAKGRPPGDGADSGDDAVSVRMGNVCASHYYINCNYAYITRGGGPVAICALPDSPRPLRASLFTRELFLLRRLCRARNNYSSKFPAEFINIFKCRAEVGL